MVRRSATPNRAFKVADQIQRDLTELIAREFEITREELDEFACRSHQLAHAATVEGRFAEEIVLVEIPGRKGQVAIFDQDESIRPETNMESLAKLRPAFTADGIVTAGNAPGLNDGAAAVVLRTPRAGSEGGQSRALARIRAASAVAVLVIAPPIVAWLEGLGVSAGAAALATYAGVILLGTTATILITEMIPGALVTRDAERVACTGERVEDYMDIELSVSESRWSAWPPVLKEQFAAARTVKPGKPSFRLALGDEGTP